MYSNLKNSHNDFLITIQHSTVTLSKITNMYSDHTAYMKDDFYISYIKVQYWGKTMDKCKLGEEMMLMMFRSYILNGK